MGHIIVRVEDLGSGQNSVLQRVLCSEVRSQNLHGTPGRAIGMSLSSHHAEQGHNPRKWEENRTSPPDLPETSECTRWPREERGAGREDGARTER